MTQNYDVVLDAQLGKRFGTLVLNEAGGEISGWFSLLGFDNPVSGTRTGQTLELRHTLRTALSTLDCETHIELHGSKLLGVVISQYSRMNLRGQKQEDGLKNEISKQD